jgi:hypothetical protein
MLALEMGVFKRITTLHTAQAQFYSRFGRFADSLQELDSAGESNGYRFRSSRTDKGYTVSANPIHCGTSGRRTFFSDETLVIHQHACPEPATATDPPVK